MSISKRKNKDGSTSFRARVKAPGGKSWLKSSWVRNLDEAKREEAQLLEEKRLGGSGWSLEDGKRYSVNEYWEVWSQANRPKVSDGWKKSQNQMMRDYVAPVIGEAKLARVQSPEIGVVLQKMRDLGRAEQTIEHVYTLLFKMFGDAVSYYRMIRDNPVSAQFHRPEVPEVESEFLNPEEVWKLLAAADKEPAVWLEALAGLRTEATVALMWDSVFFDTAQILIRRAFKQKVRQIAEYPKGKKWVYVPMTPPLRNYLLDLAGTHGTHGFVCKGPKGRHARP
jgi:integrase